MTMRSLLVVLFLRPLPQQAAAQAINQAKFGAVIDWARNRVLPKGRSGGA